jgi:hypothetical protein
MAVMVRMLSPSSQQYLMLRLKSMRFGSAAMLQPSATSLMMHCYIALW